MDTTATPPKAVRAFNLQLTDDRRERIRTASRRLSFLRDADVSMTMFILEAIDEKLEREAA